MAEQQNLLANLPTDLIIEIFSRLPSKSIAKYRCLSKFWQSILTLNCHYFTELFLTQTATRPRLLFVLQTKNNWSLYSSTQPQISYLHNKSSVTAEFYMSFPKTWNLQISPPVSGLIYCPNMPGNNDLKHPVLCNPSTGHFLWLPHLKATESSVRSYFGYDPIDKQFKVLSIGYSLDHLRVVSSDYQILKLEDGRQSWRNLTCPLQHLPLRLNICINGVLYYLARLELESCNKIACFDLNSEKFKLIDEPWRGQPKVLVNFKGKLGGISLRWIQFGNRVKIELNLWVLEDVEKQEWSTRSCPFPLRLWNRKVKDNRVSILGMTRTGDVVLSLFYVSNPFYVYVFNLEKNVLQKVEIKGLEKFKYSSVHGFVEHTEDLRLFNKI